MTKKELMNQLASLPDDFVVTIGSVEDNVHGWTNIGEIRLEVCTISLMQNYARPFSGDN